MKIKDNIKAIAILCMASFILNACTKKETATLPMPNNYYPMKIYVSTGNGPSSNLQAINLYKNGDVIVAIPGSVSLASAFVGNITPGTTITATYMPDTSLVMVYNKKNGTNYSALPANCFELPDNGMFSFTGSLTSGPGLINIKNATQLTATNGYLLPLVIRDPKGTAGVTVDTGRNTLFVQVTAVPVVKTIADISKAQIVNNQLIRNGNITAGQDVFYMQASIDKTLSMDLPIAVQVSQTLADSFNKANNTSYQPLPANSYQLQKTTATIKANAQNSFDSIQIKLSDLSVFQTGVDYLLAVQITDNGTSSVPVAQRKDIVFYHVSIFVANIDPGNAGLNGTAMDRTGWSVTSAGNPYLAASYVLDGNNATAWDGNGKLPDWIVLNMGSVQTVKGFSIVPSYRYKVDDFINMDVLSSNDGLSWKLEGRYVGTATSASSTATSPDIKTVKFFQPVKAQYFKFNVTKTTDGAYAGMGELYGIQ